MNDLWDPLSEAKGCLSRLMICLGASCVAALASLPLSWLLALLQNPRYCEYEDAFWGAQGLAPILGLICLIIYMTIKRQKWHLILLDGLATFLGTALLLIITIPNISFAPPDRCRQRNAIYEIKSVATKLDAQMKKSGKYPLLNGLKEFNKLFSTDNPITDPWRHAYYFKSEVSDYWIISYGRDGKPDLQDPIQFKYFETRAVDSDIVMHNGKFIQIPEWLMPADGKR